MKVERLLSLILRRPTAFTVNIRRARRPKHGWCYKIMCCRILGDLKGNIAYVDSLMDYQHSLGLCYPYNHYMKGELQEQLGRLSCGLPQLCQICRRE